ncbi:hypothetical protein CGLO_12970 [Colletotrichum gloeosporioides Cg-14]|uniref:Uncharacterized protein n=1 Tax=Colletotrichum gloeosporioides (strain Cg-14) TaxID=1237896 RepID=T0LI60_COLGC|nr:hypothetical protein CGLO_12970 [Colletotrichum gloeosporioides Cg-14]
MAMRDIFNKAKKSPMNIPMKMLITCLKKV